MLEAEQQFSQVVGDDLAKLAVAVQRDIGDHRSRPLISRPRHFA
jgi:hypothetical protein